MVTVRASATTGQRPVTPGIPFPSTTKKNSLPWPIEDTAAVAYRLRAHGADEDAALAVLEALEARGVRNLRAYVNHATDADVRGWITAAEVTSVMELDNLRCHVRRSVRWPWRTSTSQTFGGVVGATA